MDWSNDIHCLYRIILKLGGRIESVENHGDNMYTVNLIYPIRVNLIYPIRGYIKDTYDVPWKIKLTPGDSGV